MVFIKRPYFLLVSLGLLLSSTALQAQQFSFDSPGTRYNTPTAETGFAIYYADYLHGQPTAYGEIYDRMGFTASHRSYALGTMLKVTNLENNKSVIVRVNDKTNFAADIVISLSRAAAAQLEMLRTGKAQVRVEPVGRATETTSPVANIPSSYSDETFTSRSPYSYSNTTNQNPTTANQGFSSNFGDTGLSATNTTANRPVYSGSIYDRTPAIDQNQRSSYQSYTAPQSYDTFTDRGVSRINTSPTTNTAIQNSYSTSTWEMPTQLTGYTIQVASYQNTDNANRQVNALRQSGFTDVYTKTVQANNGQYLNKVVVGNFPNRESAERYLQTLKSQHYMDGYIIQL